jgi:hypothetical protein
LNLLAALVVLGGCVDAKEAQQAPPPEVPVVTVEPGRSVSRARRPLWIAHTGEQARSAQAHRDS